MQTMIEHCVNAALMISLALIINAALIINGGLIIGVALAVVRSIWPRASPAAATASTWRDGGTGYHGSESVPVPAAKDLFRYDPAANPDIEVVT